MACYASDMDSHGLSHAKRTLLDLIKRLGPTEATDLARRLRLTDVAVRQHLADLQKKRLVERLGQPPRGRGRPSARWGLTERAAQLFPDRHADLTVDLISATRKALGEDGLLRIVEVRAKSQARLYRTLLPRGASLKKRVEALARQRTAEGYMAEVVTEKPGCYLLIEHHCPICDAAKECLGLCSAELDVFRRALGKGVKTERITHLLSNGDRCVYRIQSA